MSWNNILFQSPLWPSIFVYVLLFSFTISASSVPLLRRLAFRFGFVDVPGTRKIHDTPTPLLGGAAIFIGIYFTIFFHLIVLNLSLRYGWFDHLIPQSIWWHYRGINVSLPRIVTFFSGGLLIFLFGLYDDKKNIGAFYRLIGEFAVAAFVVLLGVRPAIYESSHLLGFVISVGWIVGITNGFNLLDGLNGLCAGNAIISSLILAIVSIRGNNPLVIVLLMAFTGATAGFFIYNFPKGKMFLGSAGSMLIGYCLSVMVLFQPYGTRLSANAPLPFVAPILILSIPLLDTLNVMYIRFRTHMPIFQADNNHLHHRLRRLRMNDCEVACVIFLATFAIGVNATLLYRATMVESIILLLQVAAIYFILMFMLVVKERRINRRMRANGTLFAHLSAEGGGEIIFQGLLQDISQEGANCCLINLEKKLPRVGFFEGKRIVLKIMPAGRSFHGATPFLEAEGKVVWQKNWGESAVTVGVRFAEKLKETQERIESLFYMER